MVTTSRNGGSTRSKSNDASPASGSVATTDHAAGATQTDFAQFVWDRLNSLDGRFAELSESYGRIAEKLDAKFDSTNTAIGKLEGKVSKLETSVRWATAVIAAGGFIFGLIYLGYKMVESHLTIGWH